MNVNDHSPQGGKDHPPFPESAPPYAGDHAAMQFDASRHGADAATRPSECPDRDSSAEQCSTSAEVSRDEQKTTSH